MADWTSAIIGGIVGAVLPAMGATWYLSDLNTRFQAHLGHEIGGPSDSFPGGVIVASLNRCNDLGDGWQAYDAAAGRVIVGVGTATIEGFDRTFRLEEDGGYYSHVLTLGELPSHSHFLPTDGAGSSNIQTLTNTNLDDEGIGPRSSSTGVTGGGEPHNNMPPYHALYICKRE